MGTVSDEAKGEGGELMTVAGRNFDKTRRSVLSLLNEGESSMDALAASMRVDKRRIEERLDDYRRRLRRTWEARAQASLTGHS